MRSRTKALNRKPLRVRSAAQLRHDLLAVPPPDLEFTPGLAHHLVAGLQKSLQGLFQRPLAVAPAHQIEHVLAERLLAGPAEDGFSLRIPGADDALLVDLDECIERGVDDAAREAFAFAQRFLCQPALGHVTADEEKALDRLGPCSKP